MRAIIYRFFILLGSVINHFLYNYRKSAYLDTPWGWWLTCFMLIGGVVRMSPIADMSPLETLLGVLISPRTFLTSYKFGYESYGKWSLCWGPWRLSKNVCKDLMIRKLNSWAVWSGRDLISWSLERGGLGLVWYGPRSQEGLLADCTADHLSSQPRPAISTPLIKTNWTAASGQTIRTAPKIANATEKGNLYSEEKWEKEKEGILW